MTGIEIAIGIGIARLWKKVSENRNKASVSTGQAEAAVSAATAAQRKARRLDVADLGKSGSRPVTAAAFAHSWAEARR